MDGFLRSGENDVFSIGYYAEEDLPFIPAVAREFTTFDRFFCSLLASTYPNRYYMHSAQSYGMKDNTLPFADGNVGDALGWPDTTIFHSLAAAGVSNRYFYTDIPVSALWGAPGLARSGQVQEYYERCATGTPARRLLRRPVLRPGRKGGPRATNTRTATSASARPSCRTSCTRSWKAPSGSAAPCSSSTTSGAASSITCGRRASRTSARAPT